MYYRVYSPGLIVCRFPVECRGFPRLDLDIQSVPALELGRRPILYVIWGYLPVVVDSATQWDT